VQWWVVSPVGPGRFDGIGDFSDALNHAINLIEPCRLVVGDPWSAMDARAGALDRCRGLFVQYSPPAFVRHDWAPLRRLLVAARERRLPVVTTVHEYWPPPSISPRRLVQRALCRRTLRRLMSLSDVVVVTTPYAAGELAAAGLPRPEGFTIIPIGTGIPPLVPSDPSSEPPTLVMFGQPAAMNPPVLRRLAAWQASPGAPRMRWIARDAEEIRRCWRDAGGRDAADGRGLDIRGGLPAPDVSHLLAHAAAALAPYDDGASTRRSSLAALAAHGLPVVATDGRYTDRRVRESGALLLSPLGDGDAFVVNAERLLADPALRASMAAAMRRFFDAELSWPRLAAQYVAAAGVAAQRARK
jgi:glycosyltransferase involved in cell wall biosynthesis